MIDAPRASGTRRERALLGTCRLVACILLFLGLIGMLRTGLGDLGESGTMDLVRFTVHPLAAVVWFVMGLAGVAMSVAPRRARLYLLVAGPLLVLWGVIGLVTGGEATSFFASSWPNVALELVLGAGSLLVAVGGTPRAVEEALALPEPEPGPGAEN